MSSSSAPLGGATPLRGSEMGAESSAIIVENFIIIGGVCLRRGREAVEYFVVLLHVNAIKYIFIVL
jgi:hypothetical protein